MKRVSTILSLFALAFFFAFVPWGCSDDDPTGGNGEVDTTPPGVVSVTATDASHVVVVFNEAVEKNSAEDTDHYVFVEGAPPPSTYADQAPASLGDTLVLASAVVGGDGRTVTITSWQDMIDVPYDYSVTGVKDLSGNPMSTAATGEFQGTADPDITPPAVVSHIPTSGATGVPLLQTVVIIFSEAMNYPSVIGALSWTGGGGPVDYYVDAPEANRYELRPEEVLQQNTLYTVTVGSGAMDLAGLNLTETSWTFRTTAAVDNTPPTLVSTTPADGATNVPVSTNLRLQFSEAIDRNSLENIVITPEIGDGSDSWSPDGATITFDPDVDLTDDTQYTLVMGEGTVTDLAGNPIEESYVVVFSTGPNLETGGIAGQLAGDPGTAAANPAGAVVIISSVFLFDYQGQGAPPIEGVGFAGTGGVYSVTNLVDGTFWPVAMKETNDDGGLEPDYGDAVGAYGVDFDLMDGTPDSVVIAGGAPVSGIDFPLFDPSAISGMVSYAGSMYYDTWWMYDYYVGLFDQDPSGGGVDPIVGMGPNPLGSEPNYVLHQFEIPFLLSGTYYLGAYLDVNYNGDYDPAVDPTGFYMDGLSLGTVTVSNGSDAFDVDIPKYDPTTFVAAQAGWSVPPRDESLQTRAEKWERLRELLKRALEPRR